MVTCQSQLLKTGSHVPRRVSRVSKLRNSYRILAPRVVVEGHTKIFYV